MVSRAAEGARVAQNDHPRSDAPSLPPAVDDEQPAAAEPEDKMALLQQQLDEMRDRIRALEDRKVEASPLSINGYVDAGFFVPFGGGVGWVRDVGNMKFPQYSNYSWTFLGDILATAVNSRDEAADLGDAPGITRFDSIHSRGALGFIINEVNLRIGYALAERVLLRTSVNFVPRSGVDFSLGDFIDVDLAEMEFVPTNDGKTSIFVGKILPVFGIEYKERKSDQRFGVTPSLIYRYTSGTQLGVKVRSKLLNDMLILAGSVTNNSSGIEEFHFYSEIDQNNGKTLNGRAAFALPFEILPGDHLELGVSGEWGPQDWARDNGGKIWFAGGDLQYITTSFAVKAQYMKGGAPGRPEDRAWGLKLHNGAYLEVEGMFLPWLGAIGRVSLRDAVVTLGTERIYITKEIQYTVGARVVFGPHIALKGEYVHNQEYGGTGPISNDLITSSLVLSY